MPKIFYLGGRSKKNMNWIENVAKTFSIFFPKFEIIYYDSWIDESKNIDLDVETNKLSKFLEKENQFIIFAKSLGTIISLKALENINQKPIFCIFLGVPLNLLNEMNINSKYYFKNIDFKTVVVQDSEDPFASYEEMSNFLKEINNQNIRLLKENGEGHEYLNFENYKDIISSAIRS